MTESSNNDAASSPWIATGAPARELLRTYRDQLRGYAKAPSQEPDEARLADTDQRQPPLTLDDLSADICAMLSRYERSRPGVRLTPVRYVTIGGDEAPAVMGSGDLPPDDRFVSLVITETVVDAERAVVRSRMLVAERTSLDAE